jgi:hypothetical protein
MSLLLRRLLLLLHFLRHQVEIQVRIKAQRDLG